MVNVSPAQRVRILDAMVTLAGERGYAGVSVSLLSARAGVSHHTFRAAFGDLRTCFLAVLDDARRRVQAIILEAFESEEDWRDGVLQALARLLTFFDSDPVLARVLLVEASAAGPWAREQRERNVGQLTGMIEAHWSDTIVDRQHPLAAAGVMASLLGVLHSHLVRAHGRPVTELLGPLMGLVSAPFLPSELVEVEVRRGELLAGTILVERDRDRAGASREPLPALLSNSRAHRARAVVLYLAAHPGASNNQIAAAVGIARHTQISTLLARLDRAGLLVKFPGAPGRANAWTLSEHGRKVANALVVACREDCQPLYE